MDAEDAPGWLALDGALVDLYGGREPDFDYAAQPTWAEGGEDPLDVIRVFRVDGNGAVRPHWHFIGYGLSELYTKESDEADLSGFGFEVTMRVARGNEPEPPAWVIDFLQNLARYVFDTGNVFEANHQFDLGGPIAPGLDTTVEAVVFARDPQLAPMTTPFGRVEFLEVVGVTRDEHELLKDWGTEPFLAALAEVDPLLLTDLRRPSLLTDPARAAELRRRVERDGSSLGGVFVAHAAIQREGGSTVLELGASAVDDLTRLVKGRTLYDREFFLKGEETLVWVQAGDRSSVAVDGDTLTLTLERAAAEALRAAVQPRRGDYRLPQLGGFILRVVPSKILDRDGNVVRVVG
jgi:hypothetical protein